MVDIRILKTIVFSLAVVIALAIAFALPAAASFADGETACYREAYPDTANIWQPMAEEGDVWALHALAHLYEKRWDVEKDTAKA
jgi:hypothetical protein